MKSSSSMLIAALALTLSGALALAATPVVDKDVVAAKAGLAAAKISMPQAIATAEAHVAGQAIGVELDDKRNRGVYEVEVLTGDQIMEVKIDSRDGKVISAKVDVPKQHKKRKACKRR